ncbi:3-(3-hydroxy-phenyl)propionate hydroxylase [Glaciihabitans tibetensis]|uniref:3-(3-hydroxy-phenyl)propionate hydroxylase n=1 Tax=Glaciihabitans tibetensis TaxID=1266600 RepID=A0A2T0VDV6_9MICO|nr:NAD(P)/FAD-dependent oxidoreductase [Glaciihabitans tibetensis]PRY68369.1 3-(3-hydroxy-phenyl)propionate hydroxylase [Glaciihabitans tibetensis]
MTEAIDYDVIVVGGGPVGTTTALKLAKRGMKVALFEKREAATLDHRASTFHPPTLEMLDELGLTDPLIEKGILARSYQFRDAKLGKIVDLDFSVLDNDTRYPYRLQVEQSRLTAAALEALALEPNVTAMLDAEVTDVRETGAGFEVDVVSGKNGAVTASGRYLIAADGSKSLVREHYDIEFAGHTYPERYLVITTSLPLHDILDDLAVVNYVADPENWHVLLRNPSGWRVLLPSDPALSVEEQTDPAYVLSQLRRVVPVVDGYPVVHVTVYEVHRKVAATFRKGNVFLIGDAAHVNNPLGGMGMNSGIHDGLMLADVLPRVDRGESPDTDLDLWAENRRAIAKTYVGEETEGNWNALRDNSDERRAAKRAEWEALGRDEVARHKFLMTASMLTSVR